jgi:hypothetical protein
MCGLSAQRGNGTALYRLACQLDLEGIVAKRTDSRCEDNPKARNWIKIKNPAYSQKEGRGDLFKRAGYFVNHPRVFGRQKLYCTYFRRITVEYVRQGIKIKNPASSAVARSA